jgi:pimeloyl-ACP methyl ester carboxylesterase
MSCLGDCTTAFLARCVAAVLYFLHWAAKVCCCCCPSTSHEKSLAAQERVLRHFLRRSTFEIKRTPKHGVNYVVIRRSDREQRLPMERQTLVLVHGYAMGLGFFLSELLLHVLLSIGDCFSLISCGLLIGFIDNLEEMASQYDAVIAVDWLGMGCSERDSTELSKLSLSPSLAHSVEEESRAQDLAETVTKELLAGLDEVRQVEELRGGFVLAGHSLGGYLSARYALQHPEHVKGLILLSPAGVPEQPDIEDRVELSELSWKLRLLIALWRMNLTPQMLVRIAGNRGRSFVDGYFRRRLMTGSQWTDEEAEILSDYLFHITAGAGNGEYALNALLQPIFVQGQGVRGQTRNSDRFVDGEKPPPLRSGVYARQALERVIEADLKRNIPLLLIFGDSDWLYFPTAPHTVQRWKESGLRAELVVIRDADHHLHLQNAADVNKTILEWSRRNVTGALP